MAVTLAGNLLKHIFRQAYFINGTAYAGKSTMVKRLAEKHKGICCGENYHDIFMEAADPEHQPALSYFQIMGSWQEFISRTPAEYARWVDDCSREAAELEIIRLIQLAEAGKKMFVDTNIPLDMLREIASPGHVAVLLAPPSTSVERFFQRGDPEKLFLLEQIRKAPDLDGAMENFRACLAEINSPQRYRAFEEAGFFTLVRDEGRTAEESLGILEKYFGLEN